MCGICGIVEFENAASRERLVAMNDTLVRRGPDDSGYHVDGPVGLAMRRLSIIDVQGSQQPLHSDCGRYVGVFNGEIYNFRQLREDLKRRGRTFNTSGDGEVVLNMFAETGIRAFSSLRGMFGVAIWDKVDRRLILARDPLGIKPIYYSIGSERLVFGSEIKAILESGMDSLALDHQALDAYLTYGYIPAPLSIYSGVRKLEPGSVLEWRNGSTSSSRYWKLADHVGEDLVDVPKVQEELTESVVAHMVSDVPVGAFLSGGIDSSLIVSRMQSASTTPVPTYTVRFDARGSHLFDETPYAVDLRDVYGFELNIHDVSIDFDSSLTSGLEAFDEPFADDSLIPSFEVFRLASQALKVCVSGAGGDEGFGGYNRYQGLSLHTSIQRSLPRFSHRPLSRLLNALARVPGYDTRTGDLLLRFSSQMSHRPLDAYLQYVSSAPWQVRAQLFQPAAMSKLDDSVTRDLLSRHLPDAPDDDPVSIAMYLDTMTYLPEDILALADRLGMWHSMEIRVPLADKDVMALAFSCRRTRHVTATAKKKLLKRAVTPWLPRSIRHHPKQGFESPMAYWLRGEVGNRFREELRNAPPVWNDLIRTSVVNALLDEHQSGKADRAKILYALFVLLKWLTLGSTQRVLSS